jgi:hypothetical protein
MHTVKRSLAVGLALPLVAATLIAGPARADDRGGHYQDNRGGHYQHDDHHGHADYRRGPPPPRYYGQPPVVYYGAQPGYYQPPPVVYYGQPSGLSLNFNVR